MLLFHKCFSFLINDYSFMICKMYTWIVRGAPLWPKSMIPEENQSVE